MSWINPIDGGTWMNESSRSQTYKYRDPDKRRKQMREVMRRRRARLKVGKALQQERRETCQSFKEKVYERASR